MFLGLGPGRPFAAGSFVIVVPPELREDFVVAIQKSVEPAFDRRVRRAALRTYFSVKLGMRYQ